MLLTRKSAGDGATSSSRGLVDSLARGLSRAIPTMDRRKFLRRSGLGVGVGLAASQLTLVRKAEAADAPAADKAGGSQDRGQAHRVHALLGGLCHRRGGRERRVGAAGAGVRLADQPGRALRQGRGGARPCARRVPAEVPDEAGQRQVRAHQLGRGADRDQRPDARAAQGKRPRQHLHRRFVQEQQRAGVPAQKVDVPLGQQQLRPPGTNMPLHDSRRCGEYVGLRCDDQLVQRHAERQGCDVHRQQCGRSASGVLAAHAACQGKGLQDDRGRPTIHAHGRQGGPVRAHALGGRHPVPVRRDVPRLQQRLGGQEVHRGPRLRHGQGARRGAGQVDAGQGVRGLRRRRGHLLPGGQDDGREPPEHAGLVRGPHAAHHRQRHGARVVPAATGAGQHRQERRRREHLPRPRQRAGHHRRRAEPGFAAGLLRHRRGFVQALRGRGASTSSG